MITKELNGRVHLTIKKGEWVRISCKGMVREGVVLYPCTIIDGQNGWDLHVKTDSGDLFSWKQEFDGGELI